MKRFIRGWYIFWWCYHKQRQKRRGAGRSSVLRAVYTAACAQWIVDHQHRRCRIPLYKHFIYGMPLHGRIAQWVKHDL